ncbi:MAG TPA: DUF3592 domain-containing protein [Candidatus Sulfopaludibacter sp.]|nr:DUF3592 domain-containing protein [Candidatus Sulfopaludibacter sp.]
MRYAITWLALAGVIAIGIGSLNWPAYHRMMAAGVTGQARVIELLPKIHNTVRYEYHVGGLVFEGQMQSWLPNPPLEQLRVGQPLVIYYDPQHPAESVLGDPRPMLQNEMFSVALAAVVVPTFIVVTWAWRSRRHADDRVIKEAA